MFGADKHIQDGAQLAVEMFKLGQQGASPQQAYNHAQTKIPKSPFKQKMQIALSDAFKKEFSNHG